MEIKTKEAIKVGKEAIENVKELYSQGLTTGEIATKLDLPEVVVVKIVGRF